MESVETATGNIPEAPPPTEPISSAEEAVDAVESAIDQVIASPVPSADVWSQLINAGKQALDSLASAMVQQNGAGNGSEKIRVERDASSGRTYLKLEVPAPEVLGKAMLWLQTLAGALTPTQRK